MNGIRGPGGSSVFAGGLLEMGGCLFDRDVPESQVGPFNSTRRNPYAWNANATVIFVDQPISVGYSYGKKTVSHLDDAMDDLYAFVERLFAARPDWAERDFYIAGESYGGSWVPALGHKILQTTTSPLARLVASTSSHSLSSVNLKGIMVGNGLMDQTSQRRGNWETGCTSSGSGRPRPALNETQCAILAESIPRCEQLTQACEYSGRDTDVCNMSEAYCTENGFNLLQDTPWNGYDMRLNCNENPELCELPPPALMKWVNMTEVREHLGVDSAKGTPDMISWQVAGDFFGNAEVGPAHPSAPWVAELLDHGVRVLIYAGNRDWMCTAPGMKLFVDDLIWYGNGPFRSLPYSSLSRQVLGLSEARDPGTQSSDAVKNHGTYKSHSLLTFVEIEAAGHMVPMDQPEVAQAMLRQWLSGKL